MYFKINDKDFSAYVSGLKVSKAANYNAQTNAAGNTVIDLINSKRTVEATIIPVNQSVMIAIQAALNAENIVLSILNPETNTLESFPAFIASREAEYYTIQASRTLFKPFTLTFPEL